MRRVLFGLLLFAPTLLSAQGIGLPPLFDTAARSVRNTLQVEGALISVDAASYSGSAGIRARRDFSLAAISAGVGVLSDGDFGYAFAISGQLKPGRSILIDGTEKALAMSAGPIIDLNVRSVDAIGHAYTASAAVAFAIIPTFAGFTTEFTVAPRFELRSLHDDGRSEGTHANGVQLGAALGVAQFVQVLLMADWVSDALRAPDRPTGDGGWTLGLGLRHRLPGS